VSVHLYHRQDLVATATAPLDCVWDDSLLTVELWGEDSPIHTRRKGHVPLQKPPDCLAPYCEEENDRTDDPKFDLRLVVYINRSWDSYRLYDEESTAVSLYSDDHPINGWDIAFNTFTLTSTTPMYRSNSDDSDDSREDDNDGLESFLVEANLVLPTGKVELGFTRVPPGKTDHSDYANESEVMCFIECVCDWELGMRSPVARKVATASSKRKKKMGNR